MLKKIKYRPDIDGLRAVAVLAVIFFHLKLSSLSGGFAGVDIFFVISGFLISKIIITEAHEGIFQFSSFYARRARRILPVFFIVSYATLITGYFVLLTPEIDTLIGSFIASAIFLSNIFFYKTIGYFGADASQIPMLHFWSLGIEEQFYLFFPFLILYTRSWTQRSVGILLVVIILTSLIAAEIMLNSHPTAAFYLLPFRASELAIGAITYVISDHTKLKPIASEIASITGITLIVIAFVVLNETSRFPGLTAMIPCVGTALIIWAGEARLPTLSRLLTLRPIVLIGKCSYSLYLIHWPVYVFALRLYPNTDPTIRGYVCLGLTTTMALLSYSQIEKLTRNSKLFNDPKTTLKFSILIISLSIGLGIYLFSANSINNLVVNANPSNDSYPKTPDQLIKFYSKYLNAGGNTKQFSVGTCYMNENNTKNDLDLAKCIPNNESKRVVIIWGDSGIAQYSQSLRSAFLNRGYSMGQLTLSACPPVLGFSPVGRPQCEEFNEFAIEEIIKVKPDIVVLGSAWVYQSDVFNHLDSSLKRLTNAHIKAIVIGMGPLYKIAVPITLVNRVKLGNPDIMSGTDISDTTLIHKANEKMAKTVSKYPNAKFIALFDTLCPNDSCPMVIKGVPAHFDNFHVTKVAAQFFVEEFIEQIFQ